MFSNKKLSSDMVEDLLSDMAQDLPLVEVCRCGSRFAISLSLPLDGPRFAHGLSLPLDSKICSWFKSTIGCFEIRH